jgi:hypothetical protein
LPSAFLSSPKAGYYSLYRKSFPRKAKQILSGELVPVAGHKERVKEGDYGGNIIYSCMKMKNETC